MNREQRVHELATAYAQAMTTTDQRINDDKYKDLTVDIFYDHYKEAYEWLNEAISPVRNSK